MTDIDAESPPPTARKWQIDKNIPVSLIVVILIQTAGLFAWAMGLQSRVTLLETTSVTRESYARLDEKMNSVKEDLGSLKNAMANNSEDLRRFMVRGKP